MSGHRLALIACVAGLLLLAQAAEAVPIYKCRAQDGSLSYQDNPCPRDSEEEAAPRIAPPPAYVPPPPDQIALREPPPRRSSRDAEPQEPVPPLPVLYRCYDGESGKSYVSDTPRQNLRYVPLWTVLPSDPFAGVGKPTPKGSPPSANSMKGWAGANSQYTAVEDRCRQMPLGELCGYWDQHLDEVNKDRRLAFNDRRGALEQEEAGLRENLRLYCAQ